MRLAVVGSTNITQDQIFLAGKIIRGFYLEVPSRVISGGAFGIDTLAEDMAKEYNIPTIIYLPENDRWAPNGYQARNIKISEDCTHLLCIRTQQSTTYGSGWTADHAERSGKTVWRVLI